MPLTNYSFDKFVGQQLSSLTAPEIDDSDFVEISTKNWLSSFVLNAIFTKPISDYGLRLAYAWIRRAVAAVESYRVACANVRIVSRSSGKIIPYFKALDQFERTVSLCYQASDYVGKALKQKFFQNSDGTSLQRLHSVYAAIRHADLAALPDNQIHPVWLTNEGICCQGVLLRYSELEEILKDIAKTAATICGVSPNPFEDAEA